MMLRKGRLRLPSVYHRVAKHHSHYYRDDDHQTHHHHFLVPRKPVGGGGDKKKKGPKLDVKCWCVCGNNNHHQHNNSLSKELVGFGFPTSFVWLVLL